MRIPRSAIVLALTTAVISGVSNFLAKIAVTVVKDPIVFTFLKNAIVGALLIGIIIVLTRFRELKGQSRLQWIRLIFIGIVGGSIPFILFFTGLTMTSALTASMIHKTLFLWVALLAVPFLKERIGWSQTVAFLLLIGGNFALGFRTFSFGRGEVLILAATVLWALENVIAKKALVSLSSVTVAGARMVFGSAVLLAVVLAQGKVGVLSGLSPMQWWWTLLPSVLLLAYVLTWYAALKRAPATVVACLLVPATFITNVLTQVFLDKTMSTGDIVSGVCISAASLVIIFSMRYGRTTAIQLIQGEAKG